MSKKLAEHDLTIPQFAIMMTVLEESGLTQTQIGERFSMPPYATSRALDQLEKSNLIERRAHPVSRRAHGIHATQDGIALAPVLHDIVGRVNGDLTVNLTPDQREFLGDLLSKIL